MRKHINRLTTVLQKLNFVSRFFNSFPEPDFNVNGYFHDIEFIKEPENHVPHVPVIVAPADPEPQTWYDPSMENISFI